MKIAYVYFLVQDSSIGVFNKIKQQSNALDDLNDDTIDIFVLNAFENKKEGRITYLKYNRFNIFKLIFRKFEIIENLIKTQDYKFFILRYPGADKTGLSFAKKYNVIFELHSKNIEEIKLKIKNTKNNLRKFIRYINLKSEKKYQNRILNFSKGIIVVTSELNSYYRNFVEESIPIIAISNGCNINEIKHTSFTKNIETINIVFLGSRPDSWQGLDRLILSLNNFRAKNANYKIFLHLIGKINEKAFLKKYKFNSLNFIYFHGVKTGKDLDQLISKMNIAVSPIALFRKDLQEASSLKTCEYLARGIPFIIAYKDTNLAKLDHGEFYLRFANDDSLINIDKIYDFVKRNSENQEKVTNMMRKYAFENVDWKIKLKEYIQFCEDMH